MTDVIARIDDPVAIAGDTRARITMRPGGAGGNVAAWLAELDADVTLIACVGDDPLGGAMEDDLRARGVTTRFATDAAATGSVVVLVDEAGERTMLPDAAANAALAESHLPADDFRRCRHLHVSGYVLLDIRSRPAGLAALGLARETEMTISVDPASAALIKQAGTSACLDLTAGVDVLLPAYDEGRQLAGADDASVILSRLLDVYPEVALTLGSDGARWSSRDSGPISAPAAPTMGPVVDTVGAGDAFVAGWLAAGAAGADPQTQLRAGCVAGARAVTAAGAWPTRA
jgi:sugar/nucleoside kinase (ribokinase family)